MRFLCKELQVFIKILNSFIANVFNRFISNTCYIKNTVRQNLFRHGDLCSCQRRNKEHSCQKRNNQHPPLRCTNNGLTGFIMMMEKKSHPSSKQVHIEQLISISLWLFGIKCMSLFSCVRLFLGKLPFIPPNLLQQLIQ